MNAEQLTTWDIQEVQTTMESISRGRRDKEKADGTVSSPWHMLVDEEGGIMPPQRLLRAKRREEKRPREPDKFTSKSDLLSCERTLPSSSCCCWKQEVIHIHLLAKEHFYEGNRMYLFLFTTAQLKKEENVFKTRQIKQSPRWLSNHMSKVGQKPSPQGFQSIGHNLPMDVRVYTTKLPM